MVISLRDAEGLKASRTQSMAKGRLTQSQRAGEPLTAVARARAAVTAFPRPSSCAILSEDFDLRDRVGSCAHLPSPVDTCRPGAIASTAGSASAQRRKGNIPQVLFCSGAQNLRRLARPGDYLLGDDAWSP